ncbi:MAG TPA: hypothetical protein VME43_08495 [Bryobacteraceae bacterium]|nr:hypothetical protein [Bryobacteraceae bacterium]
MTISKRLASNIGIVAALFLTVAPGTDGTAAETYCCGAVSMPGERLEAVLDGMDVESRWLAKEHVNWETGRPDKGPDYDGPGRSTHCSAFAAAVAKKLGIYMLRPPDHGQVLLANAQAEWFHTKAGREAGWHTVLGPREAQRLANEGNLVVIVYESPDPHKPGHIAIIRPDLRSLRLLEENGPSVTQAGQTNFTRTSAKIGFEHHPGAWPNAVKYYAHPVNL